MQSRFGWILSIELRQIYLPHFSCPLVFFFCADYKYVKQKKHCEFSIKCCFFSLYNFMFVLFVVFLAVFVLKWRRAGLILLFQRLVLELTKFLFSTQVFFVQFFKFFFLLEILSVHDLFIIFCFFHLSSFWLLFFFENANHNQIYNFLFFLFLYRFHNILLWTFCSIQEFQFVIDNNIIIISRRFFVFRFSYIKNGIDYF